MTVENAKKIFAGDVTVISPEILQEAAKIILSELGKAEEKISYLERKNLPGEIWKDIEGTTYEVSNLGRIKNVYEMKQNIQKSTGYCRVMLSTNGNRQGFLVHRLIAKAFVPNPENFPVVDHLNSIKTDNRAENLEWVTLPENTRRATENGLLNPKRRPENYRAKLTEDDVRYIRKNFKFKDKKFGVVALAKKFNVMPAVISNVIKRRTYKNVE